MSGNSRELLPFPESFLKIPLEDLQGSFREMQKRAEKDASTIAKQIKTSSALDRGNIVAMLDSLDSKIRTAAQAQKHHIEKFRTRAEALRLTIKNSTSAEQDDSIMDVAEERDADKMESPTPSLYLDYLISDYLWRRGYFKSAEQFTHEQLRHLVDASKFQVCSRIVKELKDAQSCKGALKWCHRYRSKLRKMGSALELKLRLREFLDLVQNGQSLEAISYARKHVGPSASGPHMAAIQRAMSCLAFPPTKKDGEDDMEGSTPVSPASKIYPELFSPGVWENLANAFVTEFSRLFAIPGVESLRLMVCAGLTALKTHECGTNGNENVDCPSCSADFRRLSERLPSAPRLHSMIVCRISGEVLDENNPPLVLPNGNAYSKRALEEQAGGDPEGKVTCPRTKDRYSWASLTRAYVV